MNSNLTPPLRLPISDALVSVVLPVYNEAAVLAELCRRLRAELIACRTTFEIIFIDDGSRDESSEILDRLARQFAEVRVVHLSRNFGHQAAIHAGLSHACGDAVVLMDSDLQDSPEAIGEFLKAWQAGYDVVYAVRVNRRESVWKRTMFGGFHRFLSSISRTPIPADAGTFGLVDARVAHTIVALCEHDRYLPGLRSWVGYKQIGVPVQRGERYDRRPRVSLRGLARLAKTAIFSFSALPLSMFAWLGAISLSMFLGFSGYSVYCKLFSDVAAPAWVSHLVTMSFFAALNSLGISMLGEYVVRIYDQVRGRPLYLIDRTVNIAGQHHSTSDRCEQQVEINAAGASRMDLERLDPLELDSRWDNSYQHLFDEAQELLDLGALMHSEAADLADRNEHNRSDLDESLFAAADGEPRLLKFSEMQKNH